MAPIVGSKVLYLCPTGKGLSLLAAKTHLGGRSCRSGLSGEGVAPVGLDGDGTKILVGAYGRWRALAMRAVTGIYGICAPMGQPLIVCDVLAYLPPSLAGTLLRTSLTLGCDWTLPLFHEVAAAAAERAVKSVKERLGRVTPGDSQANGEVIIFHCYGSSHTSVVQAALYLGLLPRDRAPTHEELIRLPHFDKVIKSEIGTPMFMGDDRWGRPVYVMGFGSGKRPLKLLLQAVIAELGIPDGKAQFFDCLCTAGFLTRVGGFLSRGIGLVWLGRPVVSYSIRRNWSRFCDLSERIRARLEHQEGDWSEEGRSNSRGAPWEPGGKDRASTR